MKNTLRIIGIVFMICASAVAYRAVAYGLQGNDAISGDLFVGGTTKLLGNTTLGDSSSDTVTVTGTLTVTEAVSTLNVGALTVTGATLTNGAVTLGDASGDAITVTGTMTSTPAITATNGFIVPTKFTVSAAGNIEVAGNSTFGDTSGDTITVTGTMTSTPAITATGGFIVPTKFTVSSVGDVDAAIVKAVNFLATVPATQVVAEGNTVAADACGGVKALSAGGNVTTGTTNTFTAPASTNAGCCMDVINVDSTDTITLDGNANFIVATSTSTNVALTPGDTARVCSTGTAWYLIVSVLTP